MTTVSDTIETDRIVPCTTYAWCQGHGGHADGGEDAANPSHIGEDTVLEAGGVTAFYTPQVVAREGNGVAFDIDSGVLLTPANVEEFERAMLEIIAGVKAMLAQYPEVSE